MSALFMRARLVVKPPLNLCLKRSRDRVVVVAYLTNALMFSRHPDVNNALAYA